MKGINMKVPALAEIYNQRQTYDAHLKKLLMIRSSRKNQLGHDGIKIYQLSNIRRNLQSFETRFNTKSITIANQNSKIIKKLNKIKPSYSFQQRERSVSEYSRISNHSNKIKIFQQQKQNNRIQNRVKSISSSLNNKSLLRDYHRNEKIKNRLMRFKTDQGKVILKDQSLLEASKVYSTHNLEAKNKQTRNIPKIFYANKTEEIYQMKKKEVKINEASHYNKEDIIKNRVNISSKLLRIAKDRKLKIQTTHEKKKVVQSYEQLNQKAFFATEVQKIKK